VAEASVAAARSRQREDPKRTRGCTAARNGTRGIETETEGGSGGLDRRNSLLMQIRDSRERRGRRGGIVRVNQEPLMRKLHAGAPPMRTPAELREGGEFGFLNGPIPLLLLRNVDASHRKSRPSIIAPRDASINSILLEIHVPLLSLILAGRPAVDKPVR